MALIREVRGHTPEIGENTFLAETAVILGDVTIGKDCSIWYGAVLRGDVNTITIGDRTNIQDGAVIHTLYDKLFQEDTEEIDTIPLKVIIIGGAKRYSGVMRSLRYRRPDVSDFRDLDKIMFESLRAINSFRQKHWYWKELKLKSNE